MLLAIDVGNTNIVAGLFSGRELKQFWRMETSLRKSADEYGTTIRHLFRVDGYLYGDVDGVIISSVVPTLNYTLQHMCEKYFGKVPLFVGPEINTGLKILYDDPKALGADRIVNAAAAQVYYPGAVILIDYGTATTFCAVNSAHEYLGGVIEAGIKISSDALFEKTSKLPKIELITPEKVIGRNTVECMQSGALFSAVGATEYIVARMKAEMHEEKVTVIATGGLSDMVAANSKSIDVVDKMLTLKGLLVLWELNS